MEKKKFLSLSSIICVIVSSLVAIFMIFAPAVILKQSGHKNNLIDVWFNYIFARGIFSNSHYHWIYIIALVLLIIAIGALIAMLIMQLKDKENDKALLACVILAFIGLIVWAILAFCTKAVYVGELKKQISPSIVYDVKKYIHLGAGAIIAGLFGIAGAGCTLTFYLTRK